MGTTTTTAGPDPAVMTTVQVARRLGVRVDKLYWLIRDGKLAAPALVGRSYLWSPADLPAVARALRRPWPPIPARTTEPADE